AANDSATTATGLTRARCRLTPMSLVDNGPPAPGVPPAGGRLASALMANADIVTTDVTVSTADGPMRMYEARPADRARAAVIVVQEAFGVNPHIQDVTRRTAAAGYHAVAPEFFHRSGAGAVVEYGKFEKV